MLATTAEHRVLIIAVRVRFKYIRSVMFDGYFGAQHLPMKNPEDDVSLADGHAFTVRNTEYKRHLGTAVETTEVRSHALQCIESSPILS